MRLSVSSSSAGALAQAFSGLPAGHGHVRHRRRAKGRISLDNQPGSSSQALHHALRSFELEHTCFEDSPETTLVLPRICSKLHLCEGGLLLCAILLQCASSDELEMVYSASLTMAPIMQSLKWGCSRITHRFQDLSWCPPSWSAHFRCCTRFSTRQSLQ
ncbi:hypothetical protein F5883DRAFT_247561 [Diaporthe sp. PMI_573]|nr:hypothetical protein F5883DRAFT_247561 [Diaporthaceae sp. PMI_573]